jgi:hypothetical protein
MMLRTRLQAWWRRQRFRHLALEAMIAFCLAFMIWMYIHSRAQETLDHVQVPVHIQLATGQRDNFTLEVPGSPRVTASFYGPASRIRELRRKLQRSQVKIAVDYTVADGRAEDYSFCDTVRIEPAQVPVPPGVTVELVEETRSIQVTAHRISERLLPVSFEHSGEVRVSQVKCEPAAVLVRGPKIVLDRVQTIATASHVFTSAPDENSDATVKGQVSVATELEGRPVQVTPRQVSFRCKVYPRKRLYVLSEVPVQFLCPAQFPWRPRFAEDKHGKMTLRVIGPAGEELPPVLAYVDLTNGTYGRGRNLEPLRLQLPKDFQLADTMPPLVTFYLDDLERPTATATPADGDKP